MTDAERAELASRIQALNETIKNLKISIGALDELPAEDPYINAMIARVLDRARLVVAEWER